MKRLTFVKAVTKYHKAVTRSLYRKGQDTTLAKEATQEAIMSLVSNKSYKKLDGDVVDHSVLTYLKHAARKAQANILRKREREQHLFSSYEDAETFLSETLEDDVPTDVWKDVERDSKECPFCHTPDSLNQYGACGKCHTILPRGKTTREIVSIDESELLTEDDLDLRLDVQKALSELSEQERLVINAVVHNVETLEDIALRHDISLSSLWRLYVKAKAKLADRLLEYAFQK